MGALKGVVVRFGGEPLARVSFVEWLRSLWRRATCQSEFCGMVTFAKSGLLHAAWSYANVPGGLAAAPL
ncbi:hypothetical protein, partial [Atlantibacter sp.]|uniref:hypothetical protein n=1 Tax=Atlantibacter sp. TaxID=1903473 RepID=UPI002897041F